MKKIVINDCFGGFSLSLEGQKRYLELVGKKAYFFKMSFKDDTYELLEEKSTDDLFSLTFTVPNPQDYLKDKKNWYEMTSEQKDKYNKTYKEISFTTSDLKRDDPLLIKVVEELGHKADGRCAELKIVEIPDDVEWEIDEYDGSETIEEKHRSWS